MVKYVVQTADEWHNLRKQYITASNAATLVGLDPYSSVSKLKTPDVFTGNAFTKVGNILEPVVVQVVNEILNTSFQLYENIKNTKEFYVKGAFGATPDAHENEKTLLECKTARPHTYLRYSSVPPDKYLIQLTVQMMCTEIEEGYLAIMSTDLTQKTQEIDWPISIYKVWKDSRICSILEIEAERFLSNKTFRVSTRTKRETQLLLSMCWKLVEG